MIFRIPGMVLALVMALCFGCGSTKDAAPNARQGVIDLSEIDMSKSAPVRLDGEWEFYWKQLLTPEDFHGTPLRAVPAYLSLPAAWNDIGLNAEKLRGEGGYATFRLRILPGRGKQELALRLDDVYSAYRLWANGNLLVTSGKVGKSEADETPNASVQLLRLTGDDRPIELVLQVSNYHYREGGVVSSIELGGADRLESAQHRQWGVALFCIGSLLIMGIYHISLYYFRRKDAAPFYFGCYCLLWMLYILTSNSSGWVILLFIEKLPLQFTHRIDLFSFIISVPVGYCFFRKLYPDEFSSTLLKVISVVSALFIILGLALSTMTFTTIIPAYYLFSMLMILYCLTMLYRAMAKGREGAAFILLGFLVLGLVGINDMLCDMQLINSVYLLHIGMFVFILFQAVALSLRFSKAFTEVELLSGELSVKNLALEEEIAERTRLELEIVNISEDERRRISHDLHDGLCQQLTGARLHCSVMERKLMAAEMQSPELTQLSSLLEKSVNMAYDLSRGLWPVELDPQGVGPSLEELTRRLSYSSGIAIEFSQDRSCAMCTNAGAVQLYRIAQEAITNAVKHAQASSIVVDLNCQNRSGLTLTVHDNGIGRSAALRTEGGLGMSIMSHRAGIIGATLTVSDAEGGGTVVTCIAPCETEPR